MRLLAVALNIQLATLVSQDFIQRPSTPHIQYFKLIQSHTDAFPNISIISANQPSQSACVIFSMAETISEAIKRLDRQLVDEEDGLERIKEYAEAANETAEKAQELAEQTNDVVRRNRKLIAHRRKQLQELRGLGASSDTARQKGLLKPLGKPLLKRVHMLDTDLSWQISKAWSPEIIVCVKLAVLPLLLLQRIPASEYPLSRGLP